MTNTIRRAAVTGLLALVPSLVLAQSPDISPGNAQRTLTVLTGVGNAMGWLGVQGERYFAVDRLSVFGGIGYTPHLEDYPSGVTVAAGLRSYTAGRRHRAFLELSVSQVGLEAIGTPGAPGGARRYGPGVQIGYQYASSGGFTVAVSAGVGYALGVSAGLSGWQALGGLGLGYTWRH